jgi:diadenosine tetraphosphate (Ap4A) HIT family hydrolase
MIPKGVPSQIRDDSMVLVTVFAVVSEYQVRLKHSLQILKRLLNRFTLEREEAAAEIMDDDLRIRNAFEEQPRAGFRFGFACPFRAENHPENSEPGVLPGQLKERSTTADLDVI